MAADRLTAEQEAGLKHLLDDSIQFIDETLAEARATAARYYNAEPFGNEEDGRSQLVLSEVRDGVQGVLPSLLRVCFGPDRVLEYVPSDPAHVALAREATDAVHSLFLEQNQGFLLAHSVLKDGLIKKLGVFKWGVSDRTVEGEPYEVALPEEALALLAETQPDVQVVAVAPGDQPGTVRAILRKDGTRREHHVWAVPPEEFLFDRNARSLEDAALVGHRREVTKAELLEMGVDEATIDAHGGADTRLRDNPEAIARRETQSSDDRDPPELDEAARPYLYIEAWTFVNGVRKKVCTLGPAHHVTKVEAVEDTPPFALFVPDPEPHTLLGQSWADRLMDIQRWKSSLIRGVNDSLALAIFPRTEVVEGQANLEDVLNTEIGAPIRVKQQGAIREIAHSFLGKEALAVLGYADDIVERRTGRNRGTAGLAADSLQSSTREGVQAVLTASQEQQELLARIFAEGTLKPLFRGLLKQLVRYPTPGMVAKVGGAWQAIDPSRWDPTMAVEVNVTLGTSDPDRRVADLLMIYGEQKAYLQLLGPDNPMVGLPQLRATLDRILRARGYRDTSAFFKEIPPDWTPPPPPPPPPSPEQILANAQLEIEKMRTERELEIKAEELALKQAEQRLAHERAMAEMQAKADVDRYRAELDAKVKYDLAQLDAAVKREVAGVKAATDAAKTEASVDIAEAEITADLAKTKAQLDATPAPAGDA